MPIIDLTTDAPAGESFIGLGTIERRAQVNLEQGVSYAVEMRASNVVVAESGNGMGIVVYGGMKFGAYKCVDDDVAINAAADLAKNSDGM